MTNFDNLGMHATPHAILQQVLSAWSNHYNTPPPDRELKLLTDKLSLFDLLGANAQAALVFGYHNFEIYYINQAASQFFGYNPQDIMEQGFAALIACINPEQNETALQITQILSKKMANAPSHALEEHNTYANWQITQPSGLVKRGLVRIFPVLANAEGFPILGMYLLHDVQPFMHPHKWWCRIVQNGEVSICTHENKTLQPGDLISPREMEILKYLAQ
ncbi:MAG TPA: PAS domain-containing protein, partial [Phnomibacter sp.]|nr:PAS domain-containing protein [Phnomibacter sp.]